ncbi:argininosuccinate lyase [soil metagenome]|nr:argininosuccinate lyase [Trueperaceae bacterium]
MWGGRFAQATDELVQRFNASIDVDREMALEDVDGSIAHATMLGETGIVSSEEADALVAGLRALRERVAADDVDWSVELEDVHMNLEKRLTEAVGPIGGKLHTARSRNDQVATDFRLALRARTLRIVELLRELRGVFVDLADRHQSVIFPGYTHLQVAQPVRFSHHMLAYYEMLTRDQGRFEDSLARLDVSPLGAGALAGTGFPIDRHRTSDLLGFREPAANSLDAVSDRDFAIEFLSASSIAMMHLSRLSEELILWSSQEFGFVELPDSHTTGSSIMPQKKNPDVAELIRGKTGRVFGALMGLLTVMKGLPLTYNKDMQEDKEGAFDAAHTLATCLRLCADMLPRMVLREARMRHAAGRAFSNATDLADHLARGGLPFRQAHEAVGRLVAIALDRGVDLQDLPLDVMREVAPALDERAYAVLDLDAVVDARTSYGGTSLPRVREQIERARTMLAAEGS